MAGLVLGHVVDAVLADPRTTAHPVAAFGRGAQRALEEVWAPSRLAGGGYAVGLVLPVVAGGVVVERFARCHRLAGVLAWTAVSWAVTGGTTLRREAAAMSRALDAGDLDAARTRLPHLCGRDPAGLDRTALARATVESVAENTSDATVAPLVWAALAGLPGLLGYRAVNTLDAMVGHRTARFDRFGWAAARLDDVAGWLPARLTGLLAVALSPLVGGTPRTTWRVLARDGARHPSPNSGRCEAAFAGALGIRLGGTNVYAGRTERRPHLGDGGPPGVAHIAGAARLSRAVDAAALVLAAGFLLARGAGRPSPAPCSARAGAPATTRGAR